MWITLQSIQITRRISFRNSLMSLNQLSIAVTVKFKCLEIHWLFSPVLWIVWTFYWKVSTGSATKVLTNWWKWPRCCRDKLTFWSPHTKRRGAPVSGSDPRSKKCRNTVRLDWTSFCEQMGRSQSKITRTSIWSCWNSNQNRVVLMGSRDRTLSLRRALPNSWNRTRSSA